MDVHIYIYIYIYRVYISVAQKPVTCRNVYTVEPVDPD